MDISSHAENCDYCGEKGVTVDCIGNTCCGGCWEEMKDWTLEKQANLERLSKETNAWLDTVIPEIKKENGLAPDAPGMVCIRCRKMVESDENGLLHCDCHDERVGINPNDPGVVLISDRFLKGNHDC